jgi:hypothetical protein
MGHKKSKTRKRTQQRALVERILVEQERSSDALLALSRSMSEAPSSDQLLGEIRALLDDVLVAQHRTNHLLELALRAGFDDDERIRATRRRG